MSVVWGSAYSKSIVQDVLEKVLKGSSSIPFPQRKRRQRKKVIIGFPRAGEGKDSHYTGTLAYFPFLKTSSLVLRAIISLAGFP